MNPIAIWNLIEYAFVHVRISECTSHTPKSCQCCTPEQEDGAAIYQHYPMFRCAVQLIEGDEKDMSKLFASVKTEWERRAQSADEKLKQPNETLASLSGLFAES